MKENSSFKGKYIASITRNGEVIDSWEVDNIVPNEGLNHILDVAFSNGSPTTAFFVGLFKNNYTPVAGDTMATFPATANESTTDFSQATRPAWVEAGAASQSITNSASPASFTFTAPSTVIQGAFLSTSSVKGGTSGLLMSAARFASSRTLLAGDTLNIVYTMNALG